MEREIIKDDKDIGKYIRSYRKERHMSQKELAKKIKVSQQTISAIENGMMIPSIKMTLIILKGLDCRMGFSYVNSEKLASE